MAERTIRITVEVRKPEIYQVNFVGIGTNTHHKVPWLNVTMDDTRVVELLQSLNLHTGNMN